MSSHNQISDIAKDIKNALIQVNTLLIISLTSLTIMFYIICQIILTMININKKYNKKIEERNSNYYKNLNSSYDNDDYIYNKDELKESQDYKNFNKEIIQSIKNNNNDMKEKLKNITSLKKKLNINTQIHSSIDKNTLSNNKDNLSYKNNNNLSNFWSKLFFT